MEWEYSDPVLWQMVHRKIQEVAQSHSARGRKSRRESKQSDPETELFPYRVR
jgi:hypothetical protein